jgi:FkbM family methyltransferase
VLTVAPVALDTAATIWARGGVYEPWVVDACVALLRSGETFYDIGANIGLVATEVAQQVPDAELICFEPQHELAWHLAVSARLNGFRMMVFPTLLNDQSEVGEEKLYVPAHSIHASIVSRDARARAALAPAISLDALADHHALQPPDVVKMDVEGAELLVAKGARESLRRRPASLVFESDVNMQRFGYERSELFGLLLEIADYQFWFIPEDRSGPIAVRSVPVPRGLNGNYVALAPQHRGRLAGC